MQRVVDFLMPDNCRQSLHIAAAKNRSESREVASLLSANRDEIVNKLVTSHDRVA